MSTVADTLTVDYERIDQWLSQEDYNYSHELAMPERSLLQWFWDEFGDFIDRLFGFEVSQQTQTVIQVVSLLLLAALLVYVIYRLNPSLFKRADDGALDYTVKEDTIEGIDFDTAIAEAERSHSYREAMRLVYLQTLKWLSDYNFINWQLRKTPLQYTLECRNAAFRQLTNHFVEVRYGNKVATVDGYSTMRELQQAIRHDMTQEEGGAV